MITKYLKFFNLLLLIYGNQDEILSSQTVIPFIPQANNGILEYTTIGNDEIEWVWQVPEIKFIGIIVLVHGCNHRATDFWKKSSKCPSCIGLPEEIRIARDFAAAGYITFAISSKDRCWNANVDSIRIETILRSIQHKIINNRLPFYCFGASSGGTQCGHLHQHLGTKVSAIAIQIMALSRIPQIDLFPPSIWIHMSRDTSIGYHVKHNLLVLNQHNKITQEVIVSRVKLNETFFSIRIDTITPSVSKILFLGLVRHQIVDSDGYLYEDPRLTDWRSALNGINLYPHEDTFEADKSPISEVLNVAWAHHEITADYNQRMISFFLLFS